MQQAAPPPTPVNTVLSLIRLEQQPAEGASCQKTVSGQGSLCVAQLRGCISFLEDEAFRSPWKTPVFAPPVIRPFIIITRVPRSRVHGGAGVVEAPSAPYRSPESESPDISSPRQQEPRGARKEAGTVPDVQGLRSDG